MRIIDNDPSKNALTTDTSAAILGIHEFSLFSRIQAGEIEVTRLRSGEIAVPETELERLLGVPASKFSFPANSEIIWKDSQLGIEKHYGRLKRNGEPIDYSVPNYPGQFTESEIRSYRAAFSAIAKQVSILIDLKQQLNKLHEWVAEPQAFVVYNRWQIVSERLELKQSEILLCRLQANDFAVIERFRAESPYAKTNGGNIIYQEILLRGENSRQLGEDFKANAYHTLEFMASNLAAKAQKVVWDQFPECRPSQIMAAISERCLQVGRNEEAISQTRVITRPVNHGVKI